jgi:hypothetical protein
MSDQKVIWRSTYDRMKKRWIYCLVAVNLCWMGLSYVHYAVMYKPLVAELRMAFNGDKELSFNQLRGAVHELKVKGDILQYLRTKGMSLGQGLDIADGILEESKQQDLSVALIMGVIKTESEFYVNAKSPKGAMGVMQVMPATWNDMVQKLNLNVGIQAAFDPRINIKVGVAKLKELYVLYKKVGRSEAETDKLALSAYNAGEGGGVQTAYVTKVNKEAKGFEKTSIKTIK